MYKLILFLGICSAFASGSKQTKHSKDHEKVVGCGHVMGQPVFDPQPDLVKKGIDESLCNYLIYSFVAVGWNGSIIDDNPDPDQASDQFNHFNAHWKKSPPIKILAHMAAVSDPMNTATWESVLIDPKMRGTVVKNVVNFVKEYSLNGIDLDLSNMYAVTESRNADKQNLVLLLKELKNEFHKKGFILFVSVSTDEVTSNKSYDIKGISDNVDFIKMSFNLEEPEFQHAITHWTGNHVPPNKLILGINLKGVTQYLAEPQQFGSLPPLVDEGQYSHPADSKTCIQTRKSDVHSVNEKALYVSKMKLGGVVVHNVDRDDVDGNCGEKFGLLKALNRFLRNKS